MRRIVAGDMTDEYDRAAMKAITDANYRGRGLCSSGDKTRLTRSFIEQSSVVRELVAQRGDSFRKRTAAAVGDATTSWQGLRASWVKGHGGLEAALNEMNYDEADHDNVSPTNIVYSAIEEARDTLGRLVQ